MDTPVANIDEFHVIIVIDVLVAWENPERKASHARVAQSLAKAVYY